MHHYLQFNCRSALHIDMVQQMDFQLATVICFDELRHVGAAMRVVV
jgi:hypothetical protein